MNTQTATAALVCALIFTMFFLLRITAMEVVFVLVIMWCLFGVEYPKLLRESGRRAEANFVEYHFPRNFFWAAVLLCGVGSVGVLLRVLVFTP
jgi:hypothetical protein